MRGSTTNSFAAGAIAVIVSSKVTEIQKVSFPSRATLSIEIENSILTGRVVINWPVESVKL